jgi:hypothetical protein
MTKIAATKNKGVKASVRVIKYVNDFRRMGHFKGIDFLNNADVEYFRLKVYG